MAAAPAKNNSPIFHSEAARSTNEVAIRAAPTSPPREGGESLPPAPDMVGGESAGVGSVEAANRKACHQCRQKKWQALASCKKMKDGIGKVCPMGFCLKCLLNRYGEKLDEIATQDDWKCPKCRGVCNCSLCMKKRGHKPTGPLAHTAKAEGFSSVHELLGSKNLEVLSAANFDKSSAHCDPHPSMGSIDEEKNGYVIISNSGEEKSLINEDAPNNSTNSIVESALSMLPEGSPLTAVAGAELHPDDVGPALQFLEFCRTFCEVLQIKKGQPESVLNGLLRGCNEQEGVPLVVAKFHKTLLSIIHKDRGEKCRLNLINGDEWIKEAGACIRGLKFFPKQLALDDLNEGKVGYDRLDSHRRLVVLNLLCDETLGTNKMRSWMERENTNLVEIKKGAKDRVLAAKRKERELKYELKGEQAKAVILTAEESTPSSLQADQFAELKENIEKAHSEILEMEEDYEKKSELVDVLRTEPLISRFNGRAYWKFDGSLEVPMTLLQEIEDPLVDRNDRWMSFKDDDQQVIEKQATNIKNMQMGRKCVGKRKEV